MSSDDEEDNVESDKEEEMLDMEEDFEFGGLMGQDAEEGIFSKMGNKNGWSFSTAMEVLAKNDGLKSNEGHMEVGDIIAAARSNLKKIKGEAEEGSESETSSESVGEEMEDDIVRSQKEEGKQNEEEEEKASEFFSTAPEAAVPVSQFSQLNLCRPLLRAVSGMGFVTPTPIQAGVIPASLAGRDICGSAVTGSGKTAAFLLPTVQRLLRRPANATRALILAPTRELAAQCLSMLHSVARYTPLRFGLIVGGAKNVRAQAAELRTRPEIVVATPGRLIDHLVNSVGFHLDDLDVLVLDEADRLLEMGFEDEMEEILKFCPAQRQTLLFSATMTTKVDDLVKLSLKKPIRVQITTDQRKDKLLHGDTIQLASRLVQEFVRIRPHNECNREAILLSLLSRTFKKDRAIVFFSTKSAAHRAMILSGLLNIKATELHGNLTQLQRLEALEAFRTKKVDVLLATDLAARGLDIDGVHLVINMEMPKLETYVHRIGRTARAGKGGTSCTLIGEARRIMMKKVIRGDDTIVRTRTLHPKVIQHTSQIIKELEPHVIDVMKAEAVARIDRLADMEISRIENTVKYKDDIESRPRRQWFVGKNAQAEREAEREAREQERVERLNNKPKQEETRKRRRAREAREMGERDREEMRREREESGKDPNSMYDANKSVKAIKRNQVVKEKQSWGTGTSLSEHDYQLKLKKKATEKKQRKFAEDSLGDSSLFAEEKIAHAVKNPDQPAVSSEYNFVEYDPDKSFGKGGKKGKGKFKSKSKHKRRK